MIIALLLAVAAIALACVLLAGPLGKKEQVERKVYQLSPEAESQLDPITAATILRAANTGEMVLISDLSNEDEVRRVLGDFYPGGQA